MQGGYVHKLFLCLYVVWRRILDEEEALNIHYSITK